MNEYKLMFTISIKASDDPDARSRAREVADSVDSIVAGAEVKLQQVYLDKPPRRVKVR